MAPAKVTTACETKGRQTCASYPNEIIFNSLRVCLRISGFWLHRRTSVRTQTNEQNNRPTERGPGVAFIGVIIAFFTVAERLLAASANMRVYFLGSGDTAWCRNRTESMVQAENREIVRLVLGCEGARDYHHQKNRVV